MTETREAACQCGQLRVRTSGEPRGVFLCHCLECQRRTGSAFGVQAAFETGQVQVTGRVHDYSRISDEADRAEHVFHFCPDCGSHVFQSESVEPELVFVAVGAFADPSFPAPTRSAYNGRRHPWVELADSIPSDTELQDAVRSLYNAACRESLAGRTDDAVEHLRQVIAMWDGCRDMARDDADFDPIRDEPAFAQLLMVEPVQAPLHRQEGT